MADFLEERLSDLIRYGSSWADDYTVQVTRTSGGQEYRSLTHAYPVRRFDISYLLSRDDLWANLLAIYHRAHGKYAGFRARCFDEWSSNGFVGTPTAFDQTMGLVSAGVYELRKYYGTAGTAGAAGYPYRRIWKPVAGTVRVAIGSVEMAQSAPTWDVDPTTGVVTFPADGSAPITAISKAAQARISVGAISGAIYTGQSVYISGVSGMTQINNMRGLVTQTGSGFIDVAIDSNAFSTYVSSGNVHTRPQAGEQVTAGYEFDFPVRFDTTIPVGQDYPNYRPVEGVQLIELLNP